MNDPNHLMPLRPGHPYPYSSYVMLIPGGDLLFFPSRDTYDGDDDDDAEGEGSGGDRRPINVTDKAVEFLLTCPLVFSPPDRWSSTDEAFYTAYGPGDLGWAKGEPGLLDLFILLDKNRDTLGPIFRSLWFTEWVDHAMALIRDGRVPDLSSLKFIAFRYALDRYIDVEGIPTDGFASPEVCIVGFDATASGGKDTLIRYGISPGPLDEFLALPLRMDARILLDPAGPLDEDRGGFRDPMDRALDPSDKNRDQLLAGPGVWTLGSVVQGLLYELSFHGSPSMSEEFRQEILRRAQDFDSDPSSGIPLSDVVARLAARRLNRGEE